jgi:alcohol dehydrogenase class IV
MDSDYFFDLIVPQRIVFGWGRRREAGRWARTLGRRAWLVCGLQWDPTGRLMAEIAASLGAEGVELAPAATLSHEPEVADVDRLAAELRGREPGEGDFLLAIGGGAVIDLAKAAAAMATNREGAGVKDYLEGVGRGLTLLHPPLPLMAMPTTAGTGAEATRNAVISSYGPPLKKSLRDDRLMPRIALVDPELTVTAPPDVTAASGMDAITQLIESYVSKKRRPIASAIAARGLDVALPAIVTAVEDGRSREAREAMSLAALLSGITLTNAGLGMAHGVAAALGIHCRVAHGAACALMLPVAIRANLGACRGQFAEIARLTAPPAPAGRPTGGPTAETFLAEIETVCDRVGTPRRLSQVGVTRDQIPAIVKSSRGSSMSGNPRELSDAELTKILEDIL